MMESKLSGYEDLFQAYELLKSRDMALVVQPMEGMAERPVAGLIRTQEGIAFADIGWRDLGRHPFHHIRGSIEGEGPWTVGSAKIRRQYFVEDLITEEWLEWMDYTRKVPGLSFADAEAELRNEFVRRSS